MNRKDFFKKLGIGALAVVVAPKVLAENKSEINPNHNDIDAINGGYGETFWVNEKMYFHLSEEDRMKMMKLWRETGIICYSSHGQAQTDRFMD